MEKNNSFIVLAIIIGILLLVLGYWSVIRPAGIKKECYDYAYGTPNNGDTKEWKTATEYYYEACLHRKGL